VAAIVSSIARPPERGGDDSTATAPRAAKPGAPAAEPRTETPEPTTIEFRPGARPRTRKLELGRPATVLVDVKTAGQIEIPSLGLTEPAEPLTPARFEVLVTTRGSHAIMARPAASDGPPSKVGTLKVVPAS